MVLFYQPLFNVTIATVITPLPSEFALAFVPNETIQYLRPYSHVGIHVCLCLHVLL